uniref:Uncharacterized protein n=1 Tax=Plectus sambesii TaxID=2011161 RepID=A0A914V3J4_9BILA
MKLFKNMTSEVSRLGTVLAAFDFNTDIIQATSFIADKFKCHRVEDYCSYFELAALEVHQAAEGFNVNDIRKKKIGGKKIFANMSTAEVDRLGRVLSSKNYRSDFIQAAVYIAGRVGCTKVGEFCSYVELVVNKVKAAAKGPRKCLCRGLSVNDIQEVKIGGRLIFANMSIAEVDRLERVLYKLGYNSEIIQAAVYIAGKRRCQSGRVLQLL